MFDDRMKGLDPILKSSKPTVNMKSARKKRGRKKGKSKRKKKKKGKKKGLPKVLKGLNNSNFLQLLLFLLGKKTGSDKDKKEKKPRKMRLAVRGGRISRGGYGLPNTRIGGGQQKRDYKKNKNETEKSYQTRLNAQMMEDYPQMMIFKELLKSKSEGEAKEKLDEYVVSKENLQLSKSFGKLIRFRKELSGEISREQVDSVRNLMDATLGEMTDELVDAYIAPRKGRDNKLVQEGVIEAEGELGVEREQEPKKKRGRPSGSKNKPPPVPSATVPQPAGSIDSSIDPLTGFAVPRGPVSLQSVEDRLSETDTRKITIGPKPKLPASLPSYQQTISQGVKELEEADKQRLARESSPDYPSLIPAPPSPETARGLIRAKSLNDEADTRRAERYVSSVAGSVPSSVPSSSVPTTVVSSVNRRPYDFTPFKNYIKEFRTKDFSKLSNEDRASLAYNFIVSEGRPKYFKEQASKEGDVGKQDRPFKALFYRDLLNSAKGESISMTNIERTVKKYEEGLKQPGEVKKMKQSKSGKKGFLTKNRDMANTYDLQQLSSIDFNTFKTARELENKPPSVISDKSFKVGQPSLPSSSPRTLPMPSGDNDEAVIRGLEIYNRPQSRAEAEKQARIAVEIQETQRSGLLIGSSQGSKSPTTIARWEEYRRQVARDDSAIPPKPPSPRTPPAPPPEPQKPGVTRNPRKPGGMTSKVSRGKNPLTPAKVLSSEIGQSIAEQAPQNLGLFGIGRKNQPDDFEDLESVSSVAESQKGMFEDEPLLGPGDDPF
tara:strand:+ start:6236 stop:8557 length:2322 start_codon:yes stop_codon:yes gene_type:complete